MDINLIKSWDSDFIKGSEYPWIVTVYDLIVISDLLEKDKNGFINYLNERRTVARHSSLEAMSELDYFGYYLDYGNLKKLKKLKPATSVFIQGFSEEIDRWYSYLRGEVKYAEKPALGKK